jgi:hypothetical protein
MPPHHAIVAPRAEPPAQPVAAPAAPSAATAKLVAPSRALPTVHPEAAAQEPGPKIAAVVPSSAAKSPAPPPKGFGYLTVHSSLGYAYVYVQLVRYGQVERRLTVRCGKRLLSLGNPKRTGGEPTWFAPSRTVDIPCGGSVETTMMPKWIP